MFGAYLAKENPKATGLILTGDISSAFGIERHLEQLAEGFGKPIYFVLGNHDYYGSSWKDVDKKVRKVVYDNNYLNDNPTLHFLNDGYHMHNDLCVLGVGGWYDVRHGNKHSSIGLNDFYEIEEIRESIGEYEEMVKVIRTRARSEANRLAGMLREACATDVETILVCTHVAPYAECSWHEGKPSDNEWVPWFSSKATGDVLDVITKDFPNKTFIVLCGHSHSPGIVQVRDNLTVYTGPAKYGHPDVAGYIDTDRKIIQAHDSLGKKVERVYRP